MRTFLCLEKWSIGWEFSTFIDWLDSIVFILKSTSAFCNLADAKYHSVWPRHFHLRCIDNTILPSIHQTSLCLDNKARKLVYSYNSLQLRYHLIFYCHNLHIHLYNLHSYPLQYKANDIRFFAPPTASKLVASMLMKYTPGLPSTMTYVLTFSSGKVAMPGIRGTAFYFL